MMNCATYFTPSHVSSPEGMMPDAGRRKPGLMVLGRHSSVYAYLMPAEAFTQSKEPPEAS